MSEKRFTLEQWTEESLYFSDGEFSAHMSIGYICKKVEKKLNEQQATIQRMKHSLNTIYKAFEKHYGYDMRNAVWLIDELSYDEIVDELYIAETDSKNRKESSMYWKNKCDEQQDTISQLQDLCGESDGENAKLRLKNKELQEELKLLKPVNIEQYEQIVQLQEENEQLRQQLKEKEEDEQLYANEIVKLNKEAKEVLDFKSLGGDY